MSNGVSNPGDAPVNSTQDISVNSTEFLSSWGLYFIKKNTINKQVKNIQVIMSVRSKIGQSDFIVSLQGVGENLDGQRKPH